MPNGDEPYPPLNPVPEPGHHPVEDKPDDPDQDDEEIEEHPFVHGMS